MESKTYILDALNAIPVASTNYQEWCNVGMALKLEGFDWQVWDDWSRPDSRYRPGNCEKKWQSFHAATASPVTGGTIVAIRRGQTVILSEQALDEQAVRSAINATGYTVTSFRCVPHEKKGLFSFLRR